MRNKKLWLGMLVMVLAFSLVVCSVRNNPLANSKWTIDYVSGGEHVALYKEINFRTSSFTILVRTTIYTGRINEWGLLEEKERYEDYFTGSYRININGENVTFMLDDSLKITGTLAGNTLTIGGGNLAISGKYFRQRN